MIAIQPLPETTPDAIGFFEAVNLADMEGNWIRVSYATQRRHFGTVPFGKKKIQVQGPTVRAVWKVAFGQDWNETRLMWSMADKCWIDPETGARGSQTFHS